MVLLLIDGVVGVVLDARWSGRSGCYQVGETIAKPKRVAFADISFGIFPDTIVLTRFIRGRTLLTLALLRQLACGKERFTQEDYTKAIDKLEEEEETLLMISRIDHSLLPQNLMTFWIALATAAMETDFNLDDTLSVFSQNDSMCFAGLTPNHRDHIRFISNRAVN